MLFRSAAVYGSGSERLGAVLEQWRSVIGDGLSSIAAALPKKDLTGLADAAHRIKGSAGIAGAYAVSAEAARLEAAAREGDLANVRESAQRLQAIAATALAEVADVLVRRRVG